MTQALTLPSFKNIAFGAAGLVLALCCFFAAIPLAHASSPLPGDYTYSNGLTESQVGALLNLMTVFGADDKTVNNVSDILRNNTTGPVTNSGALWCSLATDKSSYTFGENFSVVWTSKNASYVSWVPDTSGKDNIRVTTDKMTPNGQTSFSTNVVGNPSLTMRAYASDGSTATCSKVIPVAFATPTPTRTTPTSALFVSPASGPAPLTVTFNTSASSSGGALSIDFGDGYSTWFEKVATRTYAAGSYTAKLYQCTLTLAKPCDGSTLIGTVTVTANATTSAMAPSAAVAVAPTCPPLHSGVTAISAHNEQGSCSVSTTTTGQQVAAAPQEALVAAVPKSGVPEVGELLAAAAMAPWQAAVDSLSDIFYSLGIY